MDPNTKLIIANSTRAENWEDRERASDDVRLLKEEFAKRLPMKSEPVASEQKAPELPPT